MTIVKSVEQETVVQIQGFVEETGEVDESEYRTQMAMRFFDTFDVNRSIRSSCALDYLDRRAGVDVSSDVRIAALDAADKPGFAL
jgi:hypothetical protein